MPIKFDNVFYVYQKNTPFKSDALENINVEISSHEFLALVGHTGSGKSTFVQQINALLKPTEGRVIVGDIVPFALQKELEEIVHAIYCLSDSLDSGKIYEGYHEHKLISLAYKSDEIIFFLEPKKFNLIGYKYLDNICSYNDKKKWKNDRNQFPLLYQSVLENTRSYLKDKYSKKIPSKDAFEVTNIKKIKGLKSLKKYAGLVFQFPEYQLFEETVLEDVAFGPRNFGFSKEEATSKAKDALKMVGIDESLYERSPFELSGGQKRRVAIAGIIALNPKILVLDEPTAGLDPLGTKEIMSLFNLLYQNGTEIIMITHDMDLVLKYATRVLVLNHGKLVSDTSPKELFSQDNLKEKYNLDEPLVFEFAKKLSSRGFKIDLTKVKDVHTLALEIKEKYHE